MSRDEQSARFDSGARKAAEILREEWLAAGLTPEEMAEEERLAALFDRLVAGGLPADQLLAAWEGKTAAEILDEDASPDRLAPEGVSAVPAA